jgi:hypothetical protein
MACALSLLGTVAPVKADKPVNHSINLTLQEPQNGYFKRYFV